MQRQLKYERFALVLGILALLSNGAFPGMALSQGTDQVADVALGCGSLTFTADTNNNFRLALAGGSNPGVANLAQSVYGKLTGASYAVTYQSGTTILPNEAFISVNDSRTVRVGTGCATNATDEGWLLQVSSTDFSDGASSTIGAANLYIVTTTNVSPDSGFTENAGTGNGSDTNVFYTTGFGGTKDVVAQYNVADSADLTTAAPFTGQAATLNATRDILDNATGGGSNNFKFSKVGIGIAYMLNIPANTSGGVYTATVTIDLITST